MRNFVFATFLSISVVGFSCSDSSMASVEGKSNPRIQKNLEAWHAVSMAFATGNTAQLDSVLSDDYIDHTPRGDYIGRDSVKANVARTQANIKDIKMETIKELVDEEFGFFWMRFTGNRIDAKGEISGPFDLTAIQVVRFKDGKAVEHWEYSEVKELLKMMQQRGSGAAASN